MRRTPLLVAALLDLSMVTFALRHRLAELDADNLRIKVYYMNLESRVGRAECMQQQLDALTTHASHFGFDLSISRFPAVAFSERCVDFPTCFEEVPSCFPSGYGWAGPGKNEPNTTEAIRHAMRGKFGCRCSHLKALQQGLSELSDFDYLLLLEDDVFLAPSFLEDLDKLFANFHDHWSMVAIDTFDTRSKEFPEHDDISPEMTRGLPIRSMSASQSLYWGSHAWLFNRDHLPLFLDWYQASPATNTDWINKLPRPLDVGFWAYNPGSVQQSQFVRDEDRANVKTCAQAPASDISFRLRSRGASSSSHARRALPSVTQRQVVVHGMVSEDAIATLNMITEFLEKPSGVVLCRNRTASSCGGVSFTDASWIWDKPKLSDVVAVVVVRHPFDLIEERRKLFLGDDLPCGPECQRRCEQNLNSAVDVVSCKWDANVFAYSWLETAGIFHDVVVVRYEDVLRYPRLVAKNIGESVGLPLATNLQARLSASFLEKPAGVSLDRLEYRSDDRCSALGAMCRHISKGNLWKYGYHGCENITTAYVEKAYEGRSDMPSFFHSCRDFIDNGY